ncbi:MAG: acyl-CoA carboxylase subunit beta [Bilifractor sp.]|jgi:acetyl-CoA carboxylase carboxyltransferase component
MSTMDSSAGARITSLLDPGSFVEIGAGVTARSTDFNLSEKKQPSDGVITGYGLINDNLVYIYSQDFSVMKGTIGEMHAKKIVRLFQMAVKMGAPVIGFADCAGMRLEEASDALNAFGEIYKAMSDASGVVPMITAVFGTCGGGMALIPALSDFTFMETEKASLFVNSPNALAGNHESRCDTSSAKFQSENSGLADFTGTEEEILIKIRELVTILPSNNQDDMYYGEVSDDLNRLIPDAANCIDDPALLLPRLSDNQTCVEVKKAYGEDVVTAFIVMGGTTVGAVANRSIKYNEDGTSGEVFDGTISTKGLKKAASFVKFCDAFSIPLVTLTNVDGFKATKCSETHIAKAAADLVYALTNATTPKINVITGKAFGTAGLIMNSKSVGADMVYAWTGAKFGMMDGKEAAKIMYDSADAATLKKKAKEYNDLQNSVDSAAARGYVDTVIEPEETRQYLIGSIEMLFTKRESRPAKKHGTI